MASRPQALARHPAGIVATWFGAGFLPWAPGTWGSLAALPFAYWLSFVWGTVGLLSASVMVFLVGIWAAEKVCTSTGMTDPQIVVVDEVVGQWLTLLPVIALRPDSPVHYLAGFALFRLFDITKPWPARWVDKRLSGGPGIMLDDVVAALYAGGLLYVILIAVESGP